MATKFSCSYIYEQSTIILLFCFTFSSAPFFGTVQIGELYGFLLG